MHIPLEALDEWSSVRKVQDRRIAPKLKGIVCNLIPRSESTLSHKTSSWILLFQKNGGILDPRCPSLISQRPNGPLLISIPASDDPQGLMISKPWIWWFTPYIRPIGGKLHVVAGDEASMWKLLEPHALRWVKS